MRIAFVTTATNKYVEFIPNLYASIIKFWKGKDAPTLIVLTNKDFAMPCPTGKCEIISFHAPHYRWPGPTLLRFSSYDKYGGYLKKFDFVYFIDADMEFGADVGYEILAKSVGVSHPGYYGKMPCTFPLEDRLESMAYCSIEAAKYYFAGGFYGGATDVMLPMIRELARNVNVDLLNGIIAKWHDESHLNRYFTLYPPEKVLTHDYCFPVGVEWAKELPGIPRIIAITKDHAKYRSEE